MIDKGRYNILGVQVNAIDYEAAVDKVIDAAKAGQPLATTALAVHGVMTGALDAEQRYRLNHLDLIVPDGMPVRWALNWIYKTQLPDRVYGPTLTLKICEHVAKEKLPIFLYGSKEEVIQKFAENLTNRFKGLQIVGTEPSRFRTLNSEEKEEVISKIKGSGAAITFVGLGCPRQEVWAFEYRSHLSMPIIAVGAAYDFYAGTLPQAPGWMQNRGLEWLFRLYQEPSRLWKRYLYLNPYYLFLLTLQGLKIREIDSKGSMPKQEISYG